MRENDDVSSEKERFKKEICDTIEEVEKVCVLKYLNTFIQLFIKEWG